MARHPRHRLFGEFEQRHDAEGSGKAFKAQSRHIPVGVATRAAQQVGEFARAACKGLAQVERRRRVASDRGRKIPVEGAAIERHSTALSRSEEHTSELQSLMRTSYAVFCLQKKK